MLLSRFWPVEAAMPLAVSSALLLALLSAGAGDLQGAVPGEGASASASARESPSAGLEARAAPEACAAPADAAPADTVSAAGDPEPRTGGAAGLFLPEGHWSSAALARLDAFDAVGSDLPWGMRTPTRAEAFEAFERAVAVGLARAYRDRFAEEFGFSPVRPDRPAPAIRWLAGHWDLRVGRRYGAMGTGTGHWEFVPSEPLGEPRHLDGAVGGALELGPIAAAGEIRIGEDGEPEVREAYLAGRLGPVALWGGRRAPAFGGARSGSTVLGGQVALDGAGLTLARPWILPGFLEHLGPLRFETHVARFDENGNARRPWFWSARASIAPHARVALALNRGAIFGGEGSPPMTFRNVALTILGTRGEEVSEELGRSAFANQIASFELRYRPPTGDVPTTLYLEWGMEDTSGAWWNVPGIVAGVQVAALPGAPGVSVGLERTHFAPSCCGNPPWYRHAHFYGGWADEGLPLGHPLGGQGNEWMLYGRADLLDARLRSSWRAFRRERRGENLYVPTREGRSLGGAAELLYRIGARTDLALDARYERGRGEPGWSEMWMFAGVRAYF